MTNSINPMVMTSTQTDYTVTGTSTGNGFDGDDFMLILLAQLKNQNPMEPLDDDQLMSQFTQLNSLQELQKIGNTLKEMVSSDKLLNASNLIGKEVEVMDNEGEMLTGVVTGVSEDNGQILLTIGDEEVPLDNLVSVSEAEPEEVPESTPDENTEADPEVEPEP